MRALPLRVRSIDVPVVVMAAALSATMAACNPESPRKVAETGAIAPAAARFVDFADTIHGVTVPDPLRWLEDTLSQESREWVGQQQRYTDSVIARLAFRDSIAAGLEEMFAAAPTLGEVVKTGKRLLLTRYLGSAPSLLAIDTGTVAEREIISAASIAKLGNGAALRTFVPSWNGDLMALGTTERGDANAAIAIVDAATGRVLPDAVRDLLTTTSGTRYQVSWLPENQGFFYPRLWPGAESTPSQKLSRGRQFLHRIGTPSSADVPVFGFGISADVPMAPDDLPTRVGTAPGSSWMTGSMFRSKLNGTDHYAAPLLTGQQTAAKWMRIAVVSDQLSQLKLRGDTVYALSRNNADRGKIVRNVLRAGEVPVWETVLAERAGVITEFILQDDAMYVIERAAATVNLHKVLYGSSAVVLVASTPGQSLHFARAQTGVGATHSLESWASPLRWMYAGVDSVRPLPVDSELTKPTAPKILSNVLQAPSKDGTLVPVSVVYGPSALRDGKLDGTAPLLIDAYGAFGSISDPSFDPLVQYWVSIGGVYAYAHVRGGGELGEAWHTAAVRERKQNSIDDMIGAIEHLIANRYTAAKRVSMIGVSFGANIPGLVMVQRPDLLGAVLYEVGQPDEIRGSKMDPTAARNIAEIGDLDTPEGIRLLMKMSPYHQVPATIELPAVIVHTASADYNFGTKMLAAKYVARLQKANTGESPVVWVQTDGGHVALFGVSPQWAASALSFMLWQTGDSRYQPAPRKR